METQHQTAAWYERMSLREADDIAERLGLTLLDVLFLGRQGVDPDPSVGAL